MRKIKTVLKIALPVVGEMLLYMLIWVVDTAFVGHYGGNKAVSAVGYSSEIMYTVINIFVSMGLGVGITAMVSQNIGAGKRDKAEEYLSQGLIVASILAVITAGVFALFPYDILKLAKADPSILIPAAKFMRIVSAGTFFNMVCSALNAGLRGRGNTVIPLIGSLIINIVAIGLDWVLIFGHLGFRAYGISGSAMATSAAYFSGFTFIVFYYLKYSDFKVRLRYLKEIKRGIMVRVIKLSVPAGLQEAAFSISRLVSLMFIMHLGTVAFSANQITTTIESISFMPGWGFAVASTTLVGQMIGARDFKTARQYARISAVMGISLMMICGIIFLLKPGFLISLFIDEKATLELGKYCLMVAAAEQPFTALSMVYEGALKGSGDTKTPFYLSLCSCWLVRVPLMYYVIYILKMNVVFVWVVTAVQWSLEGVGAAAAFRYRSMKWEHTMKKVLE